MSSKKKEQLGMNPSTASGRLVKDVLWKLIVETRQNMCYACSGEMTRETFSVEHKTPWLDSEDPVGLYFDLENVSFSHKVCNYSRARNFQGDKTHCPSGHPYDGENVQKRKTSKGHNSRACLPCKKKRNAERYTTKTKEENQRIRRESYEREKARAGGRAADAADF